MIKNYFYPLLTSVLIALVVVVISSCERDEEESEEIVENNLHFKGNKYRFTHGMITQYGPAAAGNSFEICLLSEGLQVNHSQSQLDSISGTGYFLFLDILSESAGLPADGIYKMNTDKPLAASGYMTGELVTHYCPDNHQVVPIAAGQITIQRMNNQFQLLIECTDHQGHSFSGYYQGELMLFDGFGMNQPAVRLAA